MEKLYSEKYGIKYIREQKMKNYKTYSYDEDFYQELYSKGYAKKYMKNHFEEAMNDLIKRQEELDK